MSDYNQQTPDFGSVDAFGAPSGAKTFFNADTPVGTSIVGTVEKIETAGVRKFKNGEITNELDYWDSGQPKIQLHIVLDTDLPPEDESDEGKRSIWIKGWGGQRRAYQDAVKRNGGKSPKPGDRFRATYKGLGEKGKMPQAPKVYEYEIIPASRSSVDAFGAATPTPMQTQVRPSGALPTGNTTLVAQLHAAGQTDEQIANITRLSVGQVQAILNANNDEEDDF